MLPCKRATAGWQSLITRCAARSNPVTPTPLTPARRHLRQGAGQGGTDQCFACANCATCREVKTLRDAQGNPTGFKEITIDASACKNDDLSWMCCRGAKNATASLACTLKTDGCEANDAPSYEYGKNKCDNVQAATCEQPAMRW